LSFPPPLHAISFDLDDTLWPVASVLSHAEAAAGEWFMAHAPNALPHLAPEPRQALRAAALAELADTDPKRHDLHHLRTRVYQMALLAGGHDEKLASTAFDVFHEARHAVEPYDEVVAVLEKLSRHFILIAITNGTAEVAKVGFAPFFRMSVSPRSAGAAKPNAAIYRHACDALQLSPATVLHAGDDVDLDVLAARAAGLKVAWINRQKRPWPGPGKTPPTFDDLEAFSQWVLPS
jgi:FMN hydrolase / 5-amino-6-(5-phospho-D-ribitylamino)uracil phosphatase